MAEEEPERRDWCDGVMEEETKEGKNATCFNRSLLPAAVFLRINTGKPQFALPRGAGAEERVPLPVASGRPFFI